MATCHSHAFGWHVRPSPPPGTVSAERVGRKPWLGVLAGQAEVTGQVEVAGMCRGGARACVEMQGVRGLGDGWGFTREGGRVASPGTVGGERTRQDALGDRRWRRPQPRSFQQSGRRGPRRHGVARTLGDNGRSAWLGRIGTYTTSTVPGQGRRPENPADEAGQDKGRLAGAKGAGSLGAVWTGWKWPCSRSPVPPVWVPAADRVELSAGESGQPRPCVRVCHGPGRSQRQWPSPPRPHPRTAVSSDF